MKMPPWSYSSLTAFETCPRQYQELRVLKNYAQGDTEATIWGKEVHGDLEFRIKDGTPLPERSAKWEPVAAKVASLKDSGYTVLTEQQFTIDREFNMTGWTSHTAWARCIIDAAAINPDKAVLLDWKTGKRKPSTQLMMSAGLVMHHYGVKVVDTGFVWLKDGKIDKERFTREQLPEIWNEFLPRVRRLELAYETDTWPVRPSGLCNGWCPVKTCKFWKEKRK